MPSVASPAESSNTVRDELVAWVQAFAPTDGTHDTSIPGLQLLRLSEPGAPLPALYEPGVVLVVQGRKVATLGTQRLVYDPLHCLVVGVTALPVAQVIDASPERPYLCVRLRAEPQHIGELARALPPTDTATATATAPASDDSALRSGFGLELSRTTPELLDAALRLLRLLKSPQDAAVLAPLVQREILYRVLIGELGPRLRALSVVDSHTQRIARAVEWLKHRYAEPLRVEDVARVAAMSPSTFHQHFKQVTSMSPLQYQKRLRLHHARQLMLAHGLDVAAAGHRVGYESASQFSREYRRLYGAPPRVEVRQVQGSTRGTA